jgi:hypothetical protein
MTPLKMCKYLAGAALIADGVIALVDPMRDARAWNGGPKSWRCLMTALEEHPTLTRAVAALEIAGGIRWATEALEPERRRLPPAA